MLHRLLFGLERVAVIWVGALLVLDQRFSVGMLFAFVAYKEQFAQRVSGADRQGGRAEDAAGCRASAWPTSCSAAPEAGRRGRAAAQANGGRRASNCATLSFRYSDSEPDVLRG